VIARASRKVNYSHLRNFSVKTSIETQRVLIALFVTELDEGASGNNKEGDNEPGDT
jgi:hypothetical protein